MTVTDELLAELIEITSQDQDDILHAKAGSMLAIYSELRRLRAENAELKRDAARLEWLIADQAIIYEQNGSISPVVYSISWPTDCCVQKEWYKTAREAIDSAMSAA